MTGSLISGNRLDPGGHENKRVAIYRFKEGETYKLVVSGRSRFFKLNRIAFRLKEVAESTVRDLSNPEWFRQPSGVDYSLWTQSGVMMGIDFPVPGSVLRVGQGTIKTANRGSGSVHLKPESMRKNALFSING